MAEGDIGTVNEYVTVYRYSQVSTASATNGAAYVPEETIQFALSAVSAAVARYCGFEFTGGIESGGSQSFTEYCSGDGSPYVRVKNIPIESVDYVSILDSDGNLTELD